MERSHMGWLFAGIGLLVAVFIRVGTLEEGHSSAYQAGAILGSIGAALAIGALLRLGYVKLIRKQGQVWSPWLLVIGAVVSLLVLAGRASDNAQSAATGSAAGDCDNVARTAEELAVALPRPWKNKPADQGVVDQVMSSMPKGAERVTARAILRGGEPVAALVAIEMPDGNGDEDELFAGFEEEAGDDAEHASLGSAEARLYRAPDGGASLVGLSDPCTAALVLGTSPEITRELAGDLPVEG